MKVGPARSAAVQWVSRHARSDAGFRGAYFSGSTVGLPDDAELSPSSDIDVCVVTAQDDPPAKPGKLRYQDALLEVSYLPWSHIASADSVLASCHVRSEPVGATPVMWNSDEWLDSAEAEPFLAAHRQRGLLCRDLSR